MNIPAKRADHPAVCENWFCMIFAKKVAKPLITKLSDVLARVQNINTGLVSNNFKAAGASLHDRRKASSEQMASLPF